jgi:hypothetical protein
VGLWKKDLNEYHYGDIEFGVGYGVLNSEAPQGIKTD